MHPAHGRGDAVSPALRPLLDLDAHPVVAHRGASGYAPENTIPAFELGVAQGADALELDVHLTADDVPIVIHDPRLERTTDLTGAVAELALRRVREADAGARFTPDGGGTFPYRGRGVRVPTLDEVLAAFTGLPIVIEVKSVRAQAAAMRVILDHGAQGRCIVASAEGAAVRLFRAPGWVTGACSSEIARLRFALPGFGARSVPYQAIFAPPSSRGVPVLTRGFVRAARRLGVPVHAWTVNDAEGARELWARGVSGIITNYPDRILAARAALSGAGEPRPSSPGASGDRSGGTGI
ncbi:MAG TPA: glycerophosphodiester phosphodiesterase [Gemmatimonadaceae bacterium]|nr:glycerophosphodiester phosphodiesterase [Gemmatimonadaceae bacterium]